MVSFNVNGIRAVLKRKFNTVASLLREVEAGEQAPLDRPAMGCPTLWIANTRADSAHHMHLTCGYPRRYTLHPGDEAEAERDREELGCC